MYQIATDTEGGWTQDQASGRSHQPGEQRRRRSRGIPKEKGQQKLRSKEEFKLGDQNGIKRVFL